jgi:glyoxylase-like metal-dependent hydrolase (beta-lactamase superfamily II)
VTSGAGGTPTRGGALEHPAYGKLRRVTDSASVLLCDNPGLLTLEGTNTWVLQGPGSDERVIVDPGPDDDAHIERIASLGKIPLVLISHKHGDHTDAIDKLVEHTGATVRAVGSGFLRGMGGPLADGEVIDAAGLRIAVMATPGHTADSLSFLVDVRGERSDGKGGAVLTADTVLGRGTTVIDNEDGSLRDYLESLRRLNGLGGRTVLPGHGPELPNVEDVTAMYLAHREQRLEQVRDALRTLGDDATARQIVEHVYTDVDEKLWDHAEWSVQAQLNYLRAE